MTKVIKLAIFLERWTLGGRETYVISHLSNMELNNFKVSILTGYKETPVFDKTISELNINFVELLDRTYGPLERSFHLKKELKKYLAEHSFDIFHANIDHGWALRYTKIASQNGIKKIIAHSHNSNVGGGFLRPAKLLAHKVGKILDMRYPTDYWACSDLAAKWLFNKDIFLRKRWIFVKNGIDLSRIKFDNNSRNDFRRYHNLKGSFVIGSIGRLEQQKNYSFLLKVFAEVAKEKPNVKLLLVGEGDQKEKLVQQAEKLMIKDSVIFYGKTSNISEVLSAMDCFVLTSKFEGFPLSGIEAQANGLPCLFSDRITTDVAFEKNQSHFIPFNSVVAWRDRLLKIQNAQRFSYNEQYLSFDIKQTSDELLLLYNCTKNI